MTWAEWGPWFFQLYALGDRHGGTVAAWVNEVFVPGGCTADELHAAALAVARVGPPAFANEILPALLAEIRRQRAEDLMAREAQDRRGGLDVNAPGCRLCDGAGWVSVPAVPQPPDAGKKGFLATCAVTCRCIQGLRLSGVARNRKDEAAMTLEQYETRYGDGWPGEVEWWHRKGVADGRIADSTKGWDEAAARVLKRAQERRTR